MLHKRLMLVFGVLLIASMVLAACAPKPPAITPTVAPATAVPPTPTPPPPHTGAWVDSVVFTSIDQAEAAVTQLQAGEIDIYAYGVADATLFETVKADPNLTYTTAFGSYTDLTFNPYGPEFTDGRLNPFSNAKVREAMNWLVNRNYLAQEVYGGLGIPKFTNLNSNFPDYARYVEITRNLEAYYTYNPTKAQEVISAEMTAMGAELVDGKWTYKGKPVTVIFLIRVEDERMEIGDYVANQLETIGFTVDRQYKTRSEASPIWVRGNPADGLFYVYTGGWITTAISRDAGTEFSFFYTPRDYPVPLWQAYQPPADFDEVALKLRNNDFATMEERGQLFAQALEGAAKFAVRIWLIDQTSFSPQSANLQVTYDLAGGVAAARLWPFTIRFEDQIGGTVRWAQPGLLVDPWNPIAGSNWVYDMTPIRATADVGTVEDPYTGLAWPQRIERAEVFAKTGLPISKTLDWVALNFVDQIDVPADAWADWDAVNQRFITVAEKYPEGTTSLVKNVVYYPADLFTTNKWHDGSPLTMGDFIMAMIMTFDPGKPESAIYDEAAAATLEAFMAAFKAVKIVSTDPLVIETYTDLYALDAELSISTWFPMYIYGPGAWHNLAVGVLAETNKELAFSADKADALTIEWMSYIAGPSLEILKKYLDQAQAQNYLPYATALYQYVTPEEATARWTNLQAWYAARGHFWLGTGPFYLDAVHPVEGTLTITRNADYPDVSDKWDRFTAPKIAVVDVDGPGQVAIGTEAAYDVFVTYADAPYPTAEIAGVKFLLYNAAGTLVTIGQATAVADGQYQIVLPADVTSQLVAGSSKLEVAVTSLVVSIPSFASFEFVAAAP